jgi:iron complex transport system substrate-binding protein
VIDIGLRAQPNRELLAELKPDLILISPLAALAPTSPASRRCTPSPCMNRAPICGCDCGDPDHSRLVNKESEAERQLAALELDLAQMQAAQPADLPLAGGAIH